MNYTAKDFTSEEIMGHFTTTGELDLSGRWNFREHDEVVKLLRGRGTVAPDEPGIDAMGITQLLYQDTPRESLGKAEQNVTKILLKLAADGLAAEGTAAAAAAAAMGNIGGATLPLEDDTASGASVNDGRAEPTVGAEDTMKLWVLSLIHI